MSTHQTKLTKSDVIQQIQVAWTKFLLLRVAGQSHHTNNRKSATLCFFYLFVLNDNRSTKDWGQLCRFFTDHFDIRAVSIALEL